MKNLTEQWFTTVIEKPADVKVYKELKKFLKKQQAMKEFCEFYWDKSKLN